MTTDERRKALLEEQEVLGKEAMRLKGEFDQVMARLQALGGKLQLLDELAEEEKRG